MGHEDELTMEELQEILNEEHQETQRNVSPSKQEEDKREPLPISAIKDLMKKWEAVREIVLEWHPNQDDVSRGYSRKSVDLDGRYYDWIYLRDVTGASTNNCWTLRRGVYKTSQRSRLVEQEVIGDHINSMPRPVLARTATLGLFLYPFVFSCLNCGSGDRWCAIYRPFCPSELNRTFTFMVLKAKANDRRTSSLLSR
ncbi:uncharacterized protein TNCV_370401 [Trichonephila clavipes]|nr:uncharacterized protein TNCV_370401 [Trichonephila clavipes]